MKVYVVMECFMGEKLPEIKGVFKDEKTAEVIKDKYRFAFISEHYLMKTQTKHTQTEVYVVYELLVLNVPNIVGVFEDENQANEVAKGCEYVSYAQKYILN